MTVQAVFDHINARFPVSSALPGDNIGILAGDPAAEVTRVMLALDCTPAVVQEAAQMGCELIITHHPLIFRPLGKVNPGHFVTDALTALLKNDIALISMHTNLDAGADGVNDCLAAALGLQDVELLPDAEGIGRMGTLPEAMAGDAFLRHVKASLDAPGLRHTPVTGDIRKVAVGGGACGDYWEQAVAAGCDALVTADIKYGMFSYAAHAGLLLIDAGHFSTENTVIEPLGESLQQAFPELIFFISAVHGDVTCFA